MLNVKDSIPKSLKFFVVYKFVCQGCNACYIGETTHHFSTRIKYHLETDKKSHIFTHPVNNETCKALSTENCFEIIDPTSTRFRLKLKEAMHIIWKNPSLNKSQIHVSISITVYSSFIFNYYVHFTLSFPFIPFSVLLSFWTFDLVSRFILNFNLWPFQFCKLLFYNKLFNWYFYQNL